MPTYWVKVAIPTYYHIVAETKQDAAQAAVEKVQNLYNTRELKPIVLEIKEFDHDEYLADAICQGPSCRDELRYMRKRW